MLRFEPWRERHLGSGCAMTGQTGRNRVASLDEKHPRPGNDICIDIDLDAGFATQIICDPEGHNEWILEAEIDLDASDAQDRAVVVPVSVRRR